MKGLFNPHCLVCYDKKRYESSVYEVRHMANRLSQLVNPVSHPINDKRLWGHITTDKKHPHFMCGSCVLVNMQELSHEEQKLHKAVYALCEKIREHDCSASDVHNALRILQGHYPKLYRIVDEERRKNKEQ